MNMEYGMNVGYRGVEMIGNLGVMGGGPLGNHHPSAPGRGMGGHKSAMPRGGGHMHRGGSGGGSGAGGMCAGTGGTSGRRAAAGGARCSEQEEGFGGAAAGRPARTAANGQKGLVGSGDDGPGLDDDSSSDCDGANGHNDSGQTDLDKRRDKRRRLCVGGG